MKKESEKVDYGESVRIRKDFVGIARQRASVEGRTVKMVIENALAKDFLPSPKVGGDTASNRTRQGGKGRR